MSLWTVKLLMAPPVISVNRVGVCPHPRTHSNFRPYQLYSSSKLLPLSTSSKCCFVCSLMLTFMILMTLMYLFQFLFFVTMDFRLNEEFLVSDESDFKNIAFVELLVFYFVKCRYFSEWFIVLRTITVVTAFII